MWGKDAVRRGRWRRWIAVVGPAGLFIGLVSQVASAETARLAGDADGLQKQARRKRPTEALRKDLMRLREVQANARAARSTLRSVAAYVPKGRASKKDRATWKKLVTIWKREAQQLGTATADWKKKLDAFERRLDEIDVAPTPRDLAAATKESQQLTQGFSLRYLNLQQNMQQENRQYTMVSNVMKVRHDTAKAAINNIR